MTIVVLPRSERNCVRLSVDFDLDISKFAGRRAIPMRADGTMIGSHVARRLTTTKATMSVKDVFTFIEKLRRARWGVTSIEYGLIAALIAMLIVSGVTTVGSKLSSIFSTFAVSI